MMYTSKGVGINALQWDELFPHLISMCGGMPKIGEEVSYNLEASYFGNIPLRSTLNFFDDKSFWVYNLFLTEKIGKIHFFQCKMCVSK